MTSASTDQGIMPPPKRPKIIVFGNEKGGTGKSTLSMHVITWLLRNGYTVGSLDVDARQGTLTRYVENRRIRANQTMEDLPLPNHAPIYRSELTTKSEIEAEETNRLTTAMEERGQYDYIVIDTPGSDTFLSRSAHARADILITPINDSFIDIDMLVRLNSDSKDILRPSIYAEMVWEQRKQKAIRERGTIDWIVVRNRMGNMYSKNRQEVGRVLQALSKRIGYRLVDGFGERVIFRELFLNGITLLDLQETGTTLSLSHIAGKQELANLIDEIHLVSKIQEKKQQGTRVA